LLQGINIGSHFAEHKHHYDYKWLNKENDEEGGKRVKKHSSKWKEYYYEIVKAILLYK